MVADKPTFAEVRAQLKAFIGDDPVLGHSVDFDVRMLAGSGLRLKQPAIDTFELATLVTPNAGSFKLTDLVKKLGAYTVSLTINLEPIYTMILAVVLLNEHKILSIEFYVSAFLIVGALLLNAWLSRTPKEIIS
jgi:DNA polymerase III alpha subunit (gram-positive type)